MWPYSSSSLIQVPGSPDWFENTFYSLHYVELFTVWCLLMPSAHILDFWKKRLEIKCLVKLGSPSSEDLACVGQAVEYLWYSITNIDLFYIFQVLFSHFEVSGFTILLWTKKPKTKPLTCFSNSVEVSGSFLNFCVSSTVVPLLLEIKKKNSLFH